jgi:hypothetical protein
MPVRDHTYYLAQDDKVFGPREDLGDFLRETYRKHAVADIECSRLDGASVWWNGDVRHVAVTYRAPDWDRATTVKLEPA